MTTTPSSTPDPIRIVYTITADRRGQLRALFASTWWAGHRDDDDVARLLAGSRLVVGLIDTIDDRLVGFCRAIGDGHVLAVILDVIVHPERRGDGLGDVLMEAMLARPELADVDSVELVCQPDLVSFYRRFGFTDRVGTSLLMRRTSNDRLRD